MLEHTTGFDEISLREFAVSRPASRLEDDINFDPRPRALRWRPGQFGSYSNADYRLAGYVLEKVSGQTFDDHLANEILRPLDMPTAPFLPTSQVKEHLATGYGQDGVTPRLEQCRFVYRLMAVRRITAHDGVLQMRGLFERPDS